MRYLVIGLVAAATACGGASTSDRKAAAEAQYQTDFATVWNVLAAAVKEDFPSAIKTEDAEVGYIETKWESVELAQDSTVGESDQRSNQRASGVGARNLFRVTARIEPGGPPWKVVIDGEAALYRPNMSVLQPYKHGAIDEPQWVPGRTDRVRRRVYEQLKQYAVADPKEKTP
jgi:hypothetical protein